MAITPQPATVTVTLSPSALEGSPLSPTATPVPIPSRAPALSSTASSGSTGAMAGAGAGTSAGSSSGPAAPTSNGSAAMRTPRDVPSPAPAGGGGEANVRVLLRARPLNALEREMAGEETCITLSGDTVRMAKNDTTVTFDRVIAPGVTQEAVFGMVGPTSITGAVVTRRWRSHGIASLIPLATMCVSRNTRFGTRT